MPPATDEQLRSFPDGGSAPASVSVDEGFFSTRPRDATWVNSWTMQVAPASIIDNRRLLFRLPKMDGEAFPYLNEARLKISVRLVDKDGNGPSDDFSVAPINNIGNSLINAVTVNLNGTVVMSCTSGLYPFWSYASALLNNTTDRKNGLLQLGGYYEDDKESWYECILHSGWDERRSLFGHYESKSASSATAQTFRFSPEKIVTFYTPLNTEFVTQAPMLNQVGGSIEITLSEPSFYLQCQENHENECDRRKFQFKIEAAELLLRVREMTPTLALNLENELKHKPIEYHNTRMDLKRFLITKGSQSFSTDQLKQNSVCPDRILFFMIPDWQVEKPYGMSPYRFLPYITEPYTKANRQQVLKRASSLINIKLSVNNQSLEATSSYINSLDLVSEKLFELYENLGLERTEHGVELSLDEYENGKFIWLYDLTKAKRAALAGNVRQEVKTGTLKLDLAFNKVLPCNAYLMTVSEFHSKVTVSGGRNITYQYLS